MKGKQSSIIIIILFELFGSLRLFDFSFIWLKTNPLKSITTLLLTLAISIVCGAFLKQLSQKDNKEFFDSIIVMLLLPFNLILINTNYDGSYVNGFLNNVVLPILCIVICIEVVIFGWKKEQLNKHL